MAFYRYFEEADVHIVDCAGTVDLQLGLARLALLERELAARPAVGAYRKLLVDFRNMVWAGDDVHRQLSAITRRAFGLDAGDDAVRVAFVHPGRGEVIAANEAWFADQADALEWLLGT
ncbi:MAG TPA: hypothetical protein VNN80_04375 [Polyangiaceae bacterium]|nr:hypothetical protein [Polyangiaceae bacterium]